MSVALQLLAFQAYCSVDMSLVKLSGSQTVLLLSYLHAHQVLCTGDCITVMQQHVIHTCVSPKCLCAGVSLVCKQWLQLNAAASVMANSS